MLDLVQSLFLLEGKINEHLSSYTKKYPPEVAKLRDDLNVDDLTTGGKKCEQVASSKDVAIEMFHEENFDPVCWFSRNNSEMAKAVTLEFCSIQ